MAKMRIPNADWRVVVALVLTLNLNLMLAAVAWGQTIGFQRESEVGVGVVTLPANKELEPVLFEGLDSCVSPDGQWIAFTEMDAAGGRFIAVGEVATGKKRRVSGIPGDNSYRPLWSPDGRTLTFDHFLSDDWVVAQVKVEGGGFSVLKGLPKKISSHAWSPDGKRLLCQDMVRFFWVEVGDWSRPVVKEVPQPAKLEGLSSATKMVVSPDGKSALVAMEVEPGPEEEFPPTAIFLLNLVSGELVRLSAKGVEVADPSWLPDGKSYLYSVFGEVPAIHQAEAKPGAVSKRVLEHAVQPSVATGIR
jgi:TolB protein